MVTIGDIEKKLLSQIADLNEVPEGLAFNYRVNGSSCERCSTENIKITDNAERTGIDIRIKDGTVGETCYIPVAISVTGHTEKVRNDFFIGENCDVTIVAGCGIHNTGHSESRHDGVHRFFVGKNSKVKYVEKHYGEAEKGADGSKIMNPETEITLEEGSYMEMETTQIKGIDSTKRVTKATVKENASIVIRERLLTNGTQFAESQLDADLIGEGSSANIISRSVATDDSRISFVSRIAGMAPCSGHTECDAIIIGNAKVLAVPALDALDPDAALIHEAAIGKIAGEQLIKLQTLGLTPEEAEEEIVNGFLK